MVQGKAIEMVQGEQWEEGETEEVTTGWKKQGVNKTDIYRPFLIFTLKAMVQVTGAR